MFVHALDRGFPIVSRHRSKSDRKILAIGFEIISGDYGNLGAGSVEIHHEMGKV